MGTQHVYSRKLAGFLFLVALVALCCGGCGKTVSKGGPALEPALSEPCLVNSEGVAGESDEETLTISDEPTGDTAEASVLGYSDAAAGEDMPTPFVTKDGYMSDQIGDTDAGSSETVTPWMGNWGEDRMEVRNEESNVEMNESGEPGDYPDGMYEETPCTPPVTEQEYTPEATGNTEEEYTPEPTGDTEQGYTPEPTNDCDNDASNTVVPYLDGENETTIGGDCSDVPRYEAYLPSMLRDVDTSESGIGPEPGPGP